MVDTRRDYPDYDALSNCRRVGQNLVFEHISLYNSIPTTASKWCFYFNDSDSNPELGFVDKPECFPEIMIGL